ncbi:hypothetical protein LSAT2_004925 [Lamellibrachia satsuma]|nr:hypothetical protein LSAT2_004925 [Lamellibrachia satsuma]
MAHAVAHVSNAAVEDGRSQSNRSNSVNANPCNICLISLRFGDGVEIFVNGDCTLTNFLQYIAERMNQNGVTLNQEEYSLIDLVDEEGNVRGIRKLPPLEHVSNCVNHRMLYIPVRLDHNPVRLDHNPENLVPKDDDEEDWQILLKPHDAYFTYIEEAMLNIKEMKNLAKQPRPIKASHDKNHLTDWEGASGRQSQSTTNRSVLIDKNHLTDWEGASGRQSQSTTNRSVLIDKNHLTDWEGASGRQSQSTTNRSVLIDKNHLTDWEGASGRQSQSTTNRSVLIDKNHLTDWEGASGRQSQSTTNKSVLIDKNHLTDWEGVSGRHGVPQKEETKQHGYGRQAAINRDEGNIHMSTMTSSYQDVIISSTDKAILIRWRKLYR